MYAKSKIFRPSGFVALALLVLASGCTGLLQNSGGNSLSMALKNDPTFANLKWKSSEVVKGNVENPTLSGQCGKNIKEVEFWVDGNKTMTAPCTNGVFSGTFGSSCPASQTCTSTFGVFSTAGRYALTILGKASKDTKQNKVEILKRIYDFRKLDANTLISFNPLPPASTNNSAEDIIADYCEEGLSVKVLNQLSNASSAFVCDSSEAFTQPVNLSVGSNGIKVSWTDDWGNASERVFTITRNPAGSPNIIVGSLSAVNVNVDDANTHNGRICANAGASGGVCGAGTAPYLVTAAVISAAPTPLGVLRDTNSNGVKDPVGTDHYFSGNAGLTSDFVSAAAYAGRTTGKDHFGGGTAMQNAMALAAQLANPAGPRTAAQWLPLANMGTCVDDTVNLANTCASQGYNVGELVAGLSPGIMLMYYANANTVPATAALAGSDASGAVILLDP